MAANATGHRKTDQLRIIGLVELAADFASEVLAPGGFFLAKVLQGGAEGELLARLKREFATVRHVKPKASRADSAELYLLATGFRGGPQRRSSREAACDATICDGLADAASPRSASRDMPAFRSWSTPSLPDHLRCSDTKSSSRGVRRQRERFPFRLTQQSRGRSPFAAPDLKPSAWQKRRRLRRRRLAAPEAKEAEAGEANRHHRPGRGLGNRARHIPLEREIVQFAMAGEVLGVEEAFHWRVVRHRCVSREDGAVPLLDADVGCVLEIPDHMLVEKRIPIEIFAVAFGEAPSDVDDDRRRRRRVVNVML